MKIPRRKLLHLLAGGAAMLSALPTCSPKARAQAYPARPVRLVIPFPPGGAFDAVGRPLAERMKPALGTLVIENIGGGGSSLGAAAGPPGPRRRPSILLGGGGDAPHESPAPRKAPSQHLPGLRPTCRGRAGAT